ncbi:MAG: hypothetical protein L3J28_03535 [Candidatus Polarisedimenticolaceae bacterium]|nr:hypothetical protein [Candidatus Polarisedimenticolaceae bacterium]
MGIFGNIFGSKNEDPEKVRLAILAYCYGNMMELSTSNITAFIQSFSENPTNALKARLFSAAKIRAGISINKNALPDITAEIIKIDNLNSILLFNLKSYGGPSNINGTPAIIPSFIAIVFNNSFIGDPAFFFLEPSLEAGSTMLIRVAPDGTRFNLGAGSQNNRDSFINSITERL